MRTPPARTAATVVTSALVLTLAAACSGTTQAVDQTAGGQFRFTDATPKGQVLPVAQRATPGRVGGPTLAGGTYSLSSDAGKVVVVNLFGSWCGPCQVETPEFQQVYDQTRAQGVDFVGFAVKERSPTDARNFVTDNAITYPVVYDQPAAVALQLGRLPVQVGLPQTVLIDKKGRVAAAYVSAVQPSQLKPAIDTLLAEG